jgi:hypothetical protein
MSDSRRLVVVVVRRTAIGGVSAGDNMAMSGIHTAVVSRVMSTVKKPSAWRAVHMTAVLMQYPHYHIVERKLFGCGPYWT